LDAESLSISIKTGANGLDFIAIRDQGIGIDDVEQLFSGQATSKITQFDDVYKTTAFGFRGQGIPI
jgi:DNA mismatch repair ATPase MutL